jgi:hypothetical protein
LPEFDISIVEGHEAPAITGAHRLLETHKPLVMIEALDQASIIEQMQGRGYQPYERVDDTLRPRSGSHYNVYFVHRDSVAGFRAKGLITG